MISIDWIAGTIGLPVYFGRKPLKITKSKLIEATKIGDIIGQRAKAWAEATRPGKRLPPMISMCQYAVISSAVKDPSSFHPDLAAAPEEVQADLLARFIDISYYLKDKEPATLLSQGLIAREIEPPATDKARYLWACSMIDNVGRIFDLLDVGAVTLAEADALKVLFPDLAMEIAVAYLRAAIEFIYTKNKPTLASWQLQGLASLLGVPLTDFNDVVMWQANFDTNQGPGRPSQKAPNLAENAFSDMQQLGIPK